VLQSLPMQEKRPGSPHILVVTKKIRREGNEKKKLTTEGVVTNNPAESQQRSWAPTPVTETTEPSVVFGEVESETGKRGGGRDR